MRFGRGARLDASQVRDRRGVGRGGVAAGGGALGGLGLLIVILLQAFGGGAGGGLADALGSLDGLQAGTGDPAAELEGCDTGADAETSQDCRILAVVNSLQAFWDGTLARQGVDYQLASTNFFTGQVSTGCGVASSAVGPFYCPADQQVYVDLGFFDQLRTDFGAQGGDFAEAYVLAHEYGHHVQHLTGQDERVGGDREGPQSGSVRLELQADCYAGVWTNHATTVADPASGEALIVELTDQDIAEALSAAEAVGDDRIQERTQGRVDPESWSHGSSDQRRRWFTTGRTTGDPAACDTFATDDL